MFLFSRRPSQISVRNCDLHASICMQQNSAHICIDCYRHIFQSSFTWGKHSILNSLWSWSHDSLVSSIQLDGLVGTCVCFGIASIRWYCWDMLCSRIASVFIVQVLTRWKADSNAISFVFNCFKPSQGERQKNEYQEQVQCTSRREKQGV